ncbi:hypothetical protein [Streptomyces sp. NPDC090021]
MSCEDARFMGGLSVLPGLPGLPGLLITVTPLAPLARGRAATA